MKKAAIILARLDSKRLPGKSLIKICGEELISHCINSLKPYDDFEPIIATSNRDIDKPIAEFAVKNGIKYFRGDAQNVSKRVLDCIALYSIDVFARINGDSLFLSRELIIEAFDKITTSNYDFVTNLVPREFPYGVSVEVIKSELFENHYINFSKPEHFEHITTYLYEHIHEFNTYFIRYAYGNDHDIRLVVDDNADLIRIEKLLENLYDKKSLRTIVQTYRRLNPTT